jgi:putative cofactor-binding repeat protein
MMLAIVAGALAGLGILASAVTGNVPGGASTI